MVRIFLVFLSMNKINANSKKIQTSRRIFINSVLLQVFVTMKYLKMRKVGGNFREKFQKLHLIFDKNHSTLVESLSFSHIPQIFRLSNGTCTDRYQQKLDKRIFESGYMSAKFYS